MKFTAIASLAVVSVSANKSVRKEFPEKCTYGKEIGEECPTGLCCEFVSRDAQRTGDAVFHKDD